MDTQATFLATLIDEWARLGVRHAVVAPGNRSTLMSALLLRDGRIKVHVMVDERSASFFALGLAKATRVPTLMWCTSGTAPAELHAAVIEADQAQVPLLVCTADRPPELQHARDWQTVDQSRLYAGAVRWHYSPGVADPAMASSWRSIADRAFEETVSNPKGAGPVHLNLAIREPWSADVGELPPGRPGERPWHEVWPTPGVPSEPLIDEFLESADQRGLILFGEGAFGADAVRALSEALGWPIIAEARSGGRRRHPNVIAAGDDILRAETWREGHALDVVLRIGAPTISKTIGAWVRDSGARQWLLDPYATWVGPTPEANTIVRADAHEFCDAVAKRFTGQPNVEWLEHWQAAEASAQRAIDSVLTELSEPAVARRLTQEMPRESHLFAATSMPIRDVEWYGIPTDHVTVWANRGASGMDGVISTAGGVSAARKDPTALLIGDLTFLYDLNALWVLKGAAEPVNLVIVVLDNDGGGIFSMLPQLKWMDPADFERVVATPQHVDIPAVATALGVNVTRVERLGDLMPAVEAGFVAGGLQLVYVRSDRALNVDVHRRIHEAVAIALQ